MHVILCAAIAIGNGAGDPSQAVVRFDEYVRGVEVGLQYVMLERAEIRYVVIQISAICSQTLHLGTIVPAVYPVFQALRGQPVIDGAIGEVKLTRSNI